MGLDIKAERDELAASVNEAVSSIKSQMEDFARFVAYKKDELSDTLKVASVRTGEQLNGMATEMRASGDRGLTFVAKTVSDNPMTALMIAAGAGMLVGMMVAGGRR